VYLPTGEAERVKDAAERQQRWKPCR